MLVNSKWKQWVKSKPWYLKWFIFLVLFRPIIDTFYDLKHVSPFLSPLYIVGVLTPILALPVIFSKKHEITLFDKVLRVITLIVFVNLIALFIYEPDKQTWLQWSIKLSLPFVLFFFLRVFIRNIRDFEGLLISLLYSTIFTAAMLLYEFFVNPISIQTTRGVERFEGGYADVMNYAAYISFAFLISSYFYLTKGKNWFGFRISLNQFFIIGAICLLGLYMAKHTTTMGVMGALIVYFISISVKRHKGFAVVFIVALLGAYSFFGDVFKEEALDPMIDREIEVIEGDRPESQLFHGRWTRWQIAFSYYEETNTISKIFGYNLSLQYPYFNVGIAVHNDFLRLFFFLGIVGFLAYVIFLYLIFRKTSQMQLYHRYLVRGFLIILLIYSLTTLPTFYAPVLYILVSSWAFAALPIFKQNSI